MTWCRIPTPADRHTYNDPLVLTDEGAVACACPVSSATGTLAVQGDGVYAASKHAVEAIADALRLEMHHFGVSVSLLVPGQVANDARCVA
jgi:short-subunit dehydrogenase